MSVLHSKLKKILNKHDGCQFTTWVVSFVLFRIWRYYKNILVNICFFRKCIEYEKKFQNFLIFKKQLIKTTMTVYK